MTETAIPECFAHRVLASSGSPKDQYASAAEGQSSVAEMARMLHDVALRYWAAGRIDDARRVALEAATLLEDEEASALSVEIASTVNVLTW